MARSRRFCRSNVSYLPYVSLATAVGTVTGISPRLLFLRKSSENAIAVANLFILNSESLYEDDSFPERELAALVAAKVYYHLQEYNESMVFALGAGKLFNFYKAGEFEERILGMSSHHF
jgi:hypothetical protein